MTMEPIQNVTVAYQGSVSAVEKTPVVTKTPEPIQTSEEQTAASDTGKQIDKIAAPEQASDSSLKKAVEEINRKSSNTEAVYGYHEGTNRVTIKIIDKDTKEIKREYPAEETLDMIQKIWEMAGLMVDEKR